jgi:excisionase family DNA binding protein
LVDRLGWLGVVKSQRIGIAVKPSIVALDNDRHTEWLSPAVLAAELDVPVQTIYAWRVRGLGPRGRRVGRHVRFAREDVNAWLEQR